MMDDSVQQTLVKVLLFAKARELAGLKQINITIPKIILARDLLDLVVTEFGLESIKDNLILAVNEEFIPSDFKLELKAQDEIAIIPPLSGG